MDHMALTVMAADKETRLKASNRSIVLEISLKEIFYQTLAELVLCRPYEADRKCQPRKDGIKYV